MKNILRKNTVKFLRVRVNFVMAFIYIYNTYNLYDKLLNSIYPLVNNYGAGVHA